MVEKWEIILLLTDIFDADELFRTKIQKMIYFASQKELMDNSFDRGYYGPYSSEIANNLQTMVEGRYLEERCHYFVNGYIGYSYNLTQDGRELIPVLRENNPREFLILKDIVKVCRNKNSDELSKAAKIHFIVKKSGSKMTDDDIIRSAKDFKWNISKEDLDSAIELLLDLDLIKVNS